MKVCVETVISKTTTILGVIDTSRYLPMTSNLAFKTGVFLTEVLLTYVQVADDFQ